jgi:outer membrane protein assembly factor BamB
MALVLVLVVAAWSSAPVAANAAAARLRDWSEQRHDAARTGFDPDPFAIGTANLESVNLLRTYSLTGSQYTSGPAVISDGLVFVSGYNLDAAGTVYAFPEHCGGAISCAPTWSAEVGRYYAAEPTVVGGVVYVGGDNFANPPTGRLYAFASHCGRGGATCKPLWTANTPNGGSLEVAPTVAGGVVYIANGSVQHGFVYAFSAGGCGHRSCAPLWRGKIITVADGAVAVSHGVVWVSDYYGFLLGFPVSCPRSTVCQPIFSGDVQSLGTGPPAASEGLVVVGSQDDNVYAFSTGCRASCPPVWVGATGKNVRSSPAIAYGQVFIASDDGSLYAFPLSCHGACAPTWHAFVSSLDSYWSSPVVVNGVVYVGWTDQHSRHGVYALPATCGTATCSPHWNRTAGYFLEQGPSPADGDLFIIGGPKNGPGDVFVYGLGQI